MKLLFPIFASLMLQYQVNTEYFGLRRCLMGFGRCKDHCTMDEKEIQKCKKKKCCIGPKVVQMIKNYMQNEMSHTLGEDSQEHLQTTKNSDAEIQTKNQILSLLPHIKSISPFTNINTFIIPNATNVNSAITNPVFSGKISYTAISIKRDTKESRNSAADSPPPSPPP
nr:PREDICTED: beta-defensin 129 [Odobenus rosmarus divergens]